MTKTFGGVQALNNVALSIQPGEVHGLLGTNGSGKSTLIKVLSGFHAPDAGSLEIDGRPVTLPMPLGRSEAHGLAFVHQNLGLLYEASVLENLIAGDHERLNPWRINWRAEAERARVLLAEYELDLMPDQIVADLSPVQRAQLAIVRAADRVREHRHYGAPGVLVLDEPTPFLPEEDVAKLFAIMRRLKESGVAIIFVSHDIDEVLEVTDRSTVLRDGKAIGTYYTASTDRETLVHAIVGRAVSVDRRVSTLSESRPIATITRLSGKILRDVSLSVRPGEILGLTGLIGSGHDEVPMLLSGAVQAVSGDLMLDGCSLDLTQLRPADAIAARIAFIPADRQRLGIAPELTLTENAMLPILGHGAWLNHEKLRRATAELMKRFTVKADNPGQAASELSGGNQQKLVLGKWLQLGPQLVLLDEPTQGIDVGARQEIYDRVAEACARGGAVICATSEFEQLETIAHRVLVFERGRIKAELKGDDVTKASIAQACYEGAQTHAAE
ncbi:sugar ABC transporter ATP-binding protein [Sedimentitalea todarodis]|uniref:Sugar ABC transporter ATP-binding protein n=1 Tax=Sedimentitalea todarodis TaxID=1631240 RepID=A0ABU3VFB9_9RHOB|nr:sugar ABC transporter ATP-binding protein [Sedimentitalea todarodis]